jgi:hypothetical protein
LEVTGRHLLVEELLHAVPLLLARVRRFAGVALPCRRRRARRTPGRVWDFLSPRSRVYAGGAGEGPAMTTLPGRSRSGVGSRTIPTKSTATTLVRRASPLSAVLFRLRRAPAKSPTC